MSGRRNGGGAGDGPSHGGIPYEAQVFGRMAAFGIVVGVAYWLLTYETAGTVLLVAFGAASGIATIAIVVGSRRPRHPGPAAAGSGQEPVPNPGWAPLVISVGLGGLALGAAFGPWLAIAGLALAIVAAKAWLDRAMGEADDARGLPTSRDRQA